MSFRIWRGEDYSKLDNWYIAGHIVSDDSNGYMAVAVDIINKPFEKDLLETERWLMQLRYEEMGIGLLSLYDSESGSSLIFSKAHESVPTPESRP
jgi:hypothetical protein